MVRNVFHPCSTMRIYVVLVLCLAGAACAKSVEDVLQALRAALENVDGAPELGTRAEGDTETVKVSENGVVFAETISFDDANNCETLHVPAHNERAEVDIRHCFGDEEGKAGKSLYCFSKESECYLLPIEDEGEPAGLEEQEEGIENFESQSNPVLDAEGIEVHANNWVVTGAADRAELPEVLASFQADFPVFFAAKIDDDAELLPYDDDATGENDKRQLPGCGNQSPVIKYIARNPSGCEYLVTCTRMGQTTSCPTRHVTDMIFMVKSSS
ncbi:Hypp4406 [Branchiostoma lanceolatum]|uniref:Hypp4406 protein n=1 Tax=Branchiostoma lanceolatum TaxID=7740 RepID=A0A8K0EY37_BRALA|nr:Hypp4406 [Branchiostoma lanceolatum]